jgi:hypothetical protein
MKFELKTKKVSQNTSKNFQVMHHFINKILNQIKLQEIRN